MLNALLENFICKTLWVLNLPLCGPENASVRGRLLLTLSGGKMYFSNDTVHRAKGKTSWPAICLSLDQGHSELRLPAPWCHGGKCVRSWGLGSGKARGNRFLLEGIQHRCCCHWEFPSPVPLCPLSLSLLRSQPSLRMPLSHQAHLLALNLEGLTPSSPFL